MAQQSAVLEHSRAQAVLRSLAGSDLYRDLDLTRLHACHTLEKLAFIALCHAMKRDVRWTIVLLQILLRVNHAHHVLLLRGILPNPHENVRADVQHKRVVGRASIQRDLLERHVARRIRHLEHDFVELARLNLRRLGLLLGHHVRGGALQHRVEIRVGLVAFQHNNLHPAVALVVNGARNLSRLVALHACRPGSLPLVQSHALVQDVHVAVVERRVVHRHLES
mmetsp:Transcript_17222/g.32880  ORF Transcript_17222/g.32880 Transcript_17222/m.32880 type:complete len:223 (-) Transcript_17222:624-1292(-)